MSGLDPKVADAAAFRALLIEADKTPQKERTAVHHILEAVAGGGVTTVFGFLHELSRDIMADAWLAQNGSQDGGDDDVAHLRFCAWRRACLMVSLTEIFHAEESAKARAK